MELTGLVFQVHGSPTAWRYGWSKDLRLRPPSHFPRIDAVTQRENFVPHETLRLADGALGLITYLAQMQLSGLEREERDDGGPIRMLLGPACHGSQRKAQELFPGMVLSANGNFLSQSEDNLFVSNLRQVRLVPPNFLRPVTRAAEEHNKETGG